MRPAILTPTLIDPFGPPALSGRWVPFIGTLGVGVGGGLQGLTQGADGIELAVNGNMETGNPPTGWPVYIGTLASAADERTGGSGIASLQATRTTNDFVMRRINLPTVASVTYAYSCWQKLVGGASTSVMLIPTADGPGYKTINNGSATWAQYTGTVVYTGTGEIRFYVTNTAGHIGRFDDISLQAMCAAAYDAAYRDRNPRVITSWLMPAAPSVVPAMMYFRATDWANKWEIWITPNTAGTDFSLIERVGGVATTRASADIDWTPGATDLIYPQFLGPTIRVYVMKAGATAWSLVLEYLGATTGLTATRHGPALFDTGVTRLTGWQPVPWI